MAQPPYREGIRTIGDTTVRFLEGGSGAPLLYLHGIEGGGRWLPALAGLASDFAVLAPEHPGFGRSDRPAWLRDVQDLILFYLDFMDAAALDTVTLVGASLGGWIAAWLAAVQPDRFRRLVLIDALGLKVKGAPIGDIFGVTPLDRPRALLYRHPERVSEPPQEEWALKNDITMARLLWKRPFDARTSRLLHRIRARTLVIWGAQDPILSPAHAEVWAKGIVGAELCLVEDAGHLPHEEDPEAFLTLVRASPDRER